MQMPFGVAYYLNLDCKYELDASDLRFPDPGFRNVNAFFNGRLYMPPAKNTAWPVTNWHASPSVTAEDGFSARYYAGFEGASQRGSGASIVPVYWCQPAGIC